MSPATEYDHLMKRAFATMFPKGTCNNRFRATSTDNCYLKAVKPDFVLEDGHWVDFKFMVSYVEKRDVPWKPSALYTSLRKYIDHVANVKKRLIIVYGLRFGSKEMVNFPIVRGRKVLVADAAEFERVIKMVSASKALERLRGTPNEWIARRVDELVAKARVQRV